LAQAAIGSIVGAMAPHGSRHSETQRAIRRRGTGQVLVIFAGAIIALLGIVAIVVDVSWYWANNLRVQRAADAAALAGAVYLPGSPASAYSYADIEATKNGYTTGGGVTVTPIQDSRNGGTDPRQLDVTVSAPVQMFFMRVFGINSIQATRTAKAIYVQPVPMGSPLNYYGVGCFASPSGPQPLCVTSPSSPNGASGISDAAGGSSQLNSQGFFGAAITKGGNSQNGDAYGPVNDNYGGQTVNPTYDPAGVYYSITVPAGDTGGSVSVFDPGFCAVQTPKYGTGDHWIGGPTNPVSTYYNLWNTNGTPFAPALYSLVTASGTLFENQANSDTVFGGPAGLGGCDAYHNKWWQMAAGLSPGTYYLQVTTTKVDTTKDGGKDVLDPTINQATNAENMFSIEANVASGAVPPTIAGAGTMVAYNNLTNPSGGAQKFYLAQVDQKAAGKTLEIDLFDIGDVSSTATLTIEDPDGNVYNNVTFNYSADALCVNSKGNCSGTGVSSIQSTFADGTHPFNDSWLTILVPLPASYGSAGLTPPGEAQPGWWKIDYTLAAGTVGNDTTTWRVSVRGNPVHLVVP
jgi:hypothetical protein